MGKQITLNGYDLLADSYNSADPAGSGVGLGNVAVSSGIFNSVGAANVFIWGKLSTSPSYTLETGPGTSIGSVAWHAAGLTGIEPGFLDTTFAFQFPDAVLPYTWWLPALGGTWEGEEYVYLLGDGDYTLPSLNLSGNEKMLVYGAARLHVRDELNLKGNAAIRILPAARLTLYVGAPTANVRGEGIINDGPVGHLQYYALAGNTTINLRLTSSFSGLVYAPRATCYLTTKGNAPAEVNGSLVVQELDLGAPARLHYDVAR